MKIIYNILQILLVKFIQASFLNVDEILYLQYGIEISKEPVLFQQQQMGEDDVMHMSSKFGQKYSCKVPMVKLPRSSKSESPEPIDPSSISKIIDQSFGDSCIEFNKGWWTYKVCHKVNVTQYHISDKGEIDSDIADLGIYEKEDNWENKNLNDKKTKQLYHTVSYTNGSLCDLTGQPRRASIQYYCGEGLQDAIIRVEEPATCEYIMTVHSAKLCDHPAFHIEEKTKKVSLICSPALTEKAYNKYLEKQKTDAAEERERQANKEKNQALAKEKEEKTGFQDNFMEGIFSKLNLNDIVRKSFDISSIDALFKGEKDVGGEKEISSAQTKDQEVKESAGAKSTNEKVAETFKKLNRRTTKIMDEQKEKLTGEFDTLRDTTLKEIRRSEDLLNNLKMLRSFGKKKEGEEEDFEDSIKRLEDTIVKNKKLVENMDERMVKIQSLEKITEQKLENTDTQINREKRFQKAAKDLGDGKTDTMGKLLKIKNLMSKYMDDPTKNKQRSRFQKLSDIITSSLTDDEEDEEGEEGTKKPMSFFDGFSKQLDRQIQKLEKMNNKDVNDDGGQRETSEVEKTIRFKSKEEEDEIEVETDAKQYQKEDLKMRVRTMKEDEYDKMMLGDESEEESEFEQNEEFSMKKKEMEKEVREKLKAAGLDVTDKIKIKVITKKSDFDKFKGGSLLSSDQADDIKDMFLNILGGGQDKQQEENRQQSLEQSYSQVWDDKEDESESP